MSRNENEDVNFLNLPDPNDRLQGEYWLGNGLQLDQKDYEQLIEECYDNDVLPPEVCAKKIHNNETNQDFYYVLMSGGRFFDPRNTHDTRYVTRQQWKFRKVKWNTFQLYTNFLKNKRTASLLQAERNV